MTAALPSGLPYVTRADFLHMLDDTWDRLSRLTATKGAEYSGPGDNQLANFDELADALGVRREVVLMVDLAKHMRSVTAYVRALEAGRQPELSEPIDGRILDMALYLVLLRCMVASAGRPPAHAATPFVVGPGDWTCRKCGHARGPTAGTTWVCTEGGACEPETAP